MFKVGDKVEVIRECSGCVPGRIYTITDGYLQNGLWHERGVLWIMAGNSSEGACHCNSNWKLVKDYLLPFDPWVATVSIGNTINTFQPEKIKVGIKKMLNQFMKKLLDANTKTLIKANFIDGNLLPTSEGKQALDAILFEANKEALVKLAQEKLDEEKENK